MSDNDQISSSPHEMYGNATTYHYSPTTEGQGGLLDSMFPSSQAYIEHDVESVIEFLNIRRQQLTENAEEMKELIHQIQSRMENPNIEKFATLRTSKDDAFLQSTELGFGLDAFQDHLSQSIGMDIRADALDAARLPVSMKGAGWHHARAELYDMQTKLTEIGDEIFHCGETARYHDKRIITPAHATSPQSTNIYYGRAPGIYFGSARSCLPGQSLSPTTLTYSSDNRDGHARLAPPRNEVGGSTVLTFMSSGIKHYRCECGYESARKGDVDHHLESLQHSERKYECSCGRKFTRYDSLHRHRKRKMQKSMGSKI